MDAKSAPEGVASITAKRALECYTEKSHKSSLPRYCCKFDLKVYTGICSHTLSDE